MPCDAIAILNARVSADITREIIDQPAPIEALRAFLEQTYKRATVFSETGRVYYEVGVGAEAFTLQFYGESLYFRGKRSTYGYDERDRERKRLAAAEETVKAFLEPLAAVAAKERLVETTKATVREMGGRVVEDVRVPGARMLKLRV